MQRPYYDRALKALEAAHKACFKHEDRPVLGMSHVQSEGLTMLTDSTGHVIYTFHHPDPYPRG